MSPPARTSETTRWIMYSLGILIMLTGCCVLALSVWDGLIMIAGGLTSILNARPSNRPETTIDMSMGKFLLTAALCTAPWIYLLMFTDPSPGLRGACVLLMLLSISVFPMLIHRKKIHTPPDDGMSN